MRGRCRRLRVFEGGPYLDAAQALADLLVAREGRTVLSGGAAVLLDIPGPVVRAKDIASARTTWP
jgi:hypothetical protein